MHATEEFIDLNHESFYDLFAKANKGDAQAQYELANYYERVNEHIRKTSNKRNLEHEKTIYRWYRLSALQDHPCALEKLCKINELRRLEHQQHAYKVHVQRHKDAESIVNTPCTTHATGRLP